MYECFHCCTRSVIWDCDYDYSDYGLEGEGIIHECHCANCGAQITYYIPIGDPDDEDGDSESGTSEYMFGETDGEA